MNYSKPEIFLIRSTNRVARVRKDDDDLVELRNGKVLPQTFTRLHNDKLNFPNSPTTIVGRRELESSLEPSVMHDDIHFTRLLLEYYDVEKLTAEEKTKRGLDVDEESKEEVEARLAVLDWLEKLPDVQCATTMSNIVGIGNQVIFAHFVRDIINCVVHT